MSVLSVKTYVNFLRLFGKFHLNSISQLTSSILTISIHVAYLAAASLLSDSTLHPTSPFLILTTHRAAAGLGVSPGRARRNGQDIDIL